MNAFMMDRHLAPPLRGLPCRRDTNPALLDSSHEAVKDKAPAARCDDDPAPHLTVYAESLLLVCFIPHFRKRKKKEE